MPCSQQPSIRSIKRCNQPPAYDKGQQPRVYAFTSGSHITAVDRLPYETVTPAQTGSGVPSAKQTC